MYGTKQVVVTGRGHTCSQSGQAFGSRGDLFCIPTAESLQQPPRRLSRCRQRRGAQARLCLRRGGFDQRSKAPRRGVASKQFP